MATKNVGTVNWQTAVDLGGLRRDLKAAEGEMQKSSRRVIAADPSGRLPPRVGGASFPGRGSHGTPETRSLSRASDSLEKITGSLSRLPGGAGSAAGGVGDIFSAFKSAGIGGGIGAIGAAGTALAIKSAERSEGVYRDAQKFKMKPQDYAKQVYGGSELTNKQITAGAGTAQAWRDVKGGAGQFVNWLGSNIMQGVGSLFTLPIEGESYNSVAERAAKNNDDRRGAIKKRYRRAQGMASSAGGVSWDEGDTTGAGAVIQQRAMEEQIYWQRQQALAAKALEEQFGEKIAEGPS